MSLRILGQRGRGSASSAPDVVLIDGEDAPVGDEVEVVEGRGGAAILSPSPQPGQTHQLQAAGGTLRVEGGEHPIAGGDFDLDDGQIAFVSYTTRGTWARLLAGMGPAGAPGAPGSPGAPGLNGVAGSMASAVGIRGETEDDDMRTSWIGVVGTGQSLSTGTNGTPVLDSTQPYRNLKLFDSSRVYLDALLLRLVPLTGIVRLPRGTPPHTFQYPDNIFGETPFESLCNQASKDLVDDGASPLPTFIPTIVGVSGQTLAAISKGGGTNAYASSMFEAQALADMAWEKGETYSVGAVALVHGEADPLNLSYGAELVQLQADYEADLSDITEQRGRIPLLMSQQASQPSDATQIPTGSTLQMWTTARENPTRFALVGPQYPYGYSDLQHMDAPNYERLGEKFAQVFKRVVLDRAPWRPLQPTHVVRDGLVISVAFDVPVEPLQWNDAMGLPHQGNHVYWGAGRGFEVVSTAGPETIASVDIVGDNTVNIIMASLTSTVDLVVRFAMIQDAAGDAAGTPQGRWGLLCDSDPYEGRDRADLLTAVVNGSSIFTLSAHDALGRTIWDRVRGGGGYISEVATVVALPAPGQFQLSEAWQGPSGSYLLRWAHEQRNYCVCFELPVEVSAEDPLSFLSDLAAYWNADEAGGDRAAWPDLSGNGKTAVQPAGGSQPALVVDAGIDNHQALDFSGSKSFDSGVLGSLVAAGSPYGVFAVIKRTDGVGGCIFASRTTTRYSGSSNQNNGAGTFLAHGDGVDVGNNVTMVEPPQIDDWLGIVWVYKGAGQTPDVYIDGLIQTVTFAGTQETEDGTAGFDIGTNAGTQFMNGRIAALAVIQHQPTTTDVANWTAFVKQLYGVGP